MLTDCGSRRILLSQVEIDHHMSSRAKSFFFARPSSLKATEALTESAVKAFIIQQPPIVYEDRKNKNSARFVCIANLFSLYVAKNRLPESEKIRAIFVAPPLRRDREELALSLAFSAESLNMLDPDKSLNYLVSLWQYIATHHPQYLALISEHLNSKIAFGEAFNINRRNL